MKSSINKITQLDMYFLKNYLPSGKGSEISEILDDALRDEDCLDIKELDDARKYLHIEINLNAPDEQLKRDFKKFLIAAKKRYCS